MDKKAKSGDDKRLPAGLKTMGKSITMRGARYGSSGGMSDFGTYILFQMCSSRMRIFWEYPFFAEILRFFQSGCVLPFPKKISI
jgi:hypothetical protein